MRFFKTTIFGGLLFLVPVVLLIIIIQKAFELIDKLLNPLTERFKGNLIGGIAFHHLIAGIALVLLCFFAGLFARTRIAKRFINWLENSVLGFVPGYQFIKSIGKTITGLEEREMEVVLARVDDGWQISFLIEQIDENMFTVFVPDAPSPWSGSVYHMEKDKIMATDMTQKEAMACIRQLGFGSATILKKDFSKPRVTGK